MGIRRGFDRCVVNRVSLEVDSNRGIRRRCSLVEGCWVQLDACQALHRPHHQQVKPCQGVKRSISEGANRKKGSSAWPCGWQEHAWKESTQVSDEECEIMITAERSISIGPPSWAEVTFQGQSCPLVQRMYSPSPLVPPASSLLLLSKQWLIHSQSTHELLCWKSQASQISRSSPNGTFHRL